MVVHACNPATQEAETGGLRIGGQPRQTNQDTISKTNYIYTFVSFYFFAVLGLKLRAYTLSHSTCPSL
jgi:hypothetical protein